MFPRPALFSHGEYGVSTDLRFNRKLRGVALKNLLNQPKTPRLRFDSQQDALDFASNCVKNSKSLFVGNNFCERYKKSEIELCVELSSGLDAEQFHLIFGAIPNKHFLILERDSDIAPDHSAHFTFERDGKRFNRKNQSMFVSVASEVQCGEEMIASFVRLERAKERQNLSRNIGAAFKCVFEVGGASGERKVSAVDILSGESCCSDRKDCMIERSPKIIHGISSDHGQLIRKGSTQADFMNRVIGLVRVWLSNEFAWAYFQEDPDLPFEFGDVFPTPCEFLVSALEGIGHD
jgi:hypothetical protein